MTNIRSTIALVTTVCLESAVTTDCTISVATRFCQLFFSGQECRPDLMLCIAYAHNRQYASRFSHKCRRNHGWQRFCGRNHGWQRFCGRYHGWRRFCGRYHGWRRFCGQCRSQSLAAAAAHRRGVIHCERHCENLRRGDVHPVGRAARRGARGCRSPAACRSAARL